MKKNKYVSYLLIVAFFIINNSCSDNFLDTESPSQQTSNVIYENTGMTRSAIMGIYSDLAGTYVYGQKMSVNWQGVSDIELAGGYQDNPSKDLTSDSGVANYFGDWYNQTTQWSYIFQMAEHASTAVEGIRNSKLYQSGNKIMKQYLGEALTLRCLAYFELVRRWGDIPFKKGMSNSDLSNVYIGKVDRDSIYESLIKDMQEAVDYLPWMGNGEYNCERVTRGFAKGLLARIALFAGGWSIRDGNQFPHNTNVEHYHSVGDDGMAEMNGYYVGRPKDWQKYYKIAEQQCAEIIGDPENPHRLDPDYGDIWKTVCSLGYNKYNENMFEVANGVGYSGDIGTLMGRAMDGNIGYGSRGFGGSYVSTNAYYFYSFSQGDARRDYACYWPRYMKEGNIIHERMQNNILNLNLGKWSFFWTSDKYRNIAKTATSRVPTGINWILMRYSDILLMFAESRYVLGEGTDTKSETAGISAREALEQVRTRAFGVGSPEITDYSNDFFEAIVNERAWEFGGEGIRKLDLVRWGLLDKKIEDMKVAMVNMIDRNKVVKCMDKIYQPSDFPDKLYYKYQSDGKTIDLSSANFYRRLNDNPDPNKYQEIGWIGNPDIREKDVVNNSALVLEAASGLRAAYDYTALLSTLQFGSQIQEKLNMVTLGNGVCNYRHLFPIYYEDIYESKGHLKNSYGYDHQN